jgi:hypothetical protein
MNTHRETESKKVTFHWLGQVLQMLVAMISVALAGPALTVITMMMLVALLLCSCVAFIVTAGTATMLVGPDRDQEAKATPTFEAKIQAYPLPAHVELFAEAQDWNFSPNGEYVLLANRSDRFIKHLPTGLIRPLKMHNYVGPDDTVWLDEHRLFVFQGKGTYTGYGFVLYRLSDDPNSEVEELWLPNIRANKATADLLAGKELFQNIDPYAKEVVAISETDGWVINTGGATDEEAFERLLAGRTVTKLPFYRGSSDWRPQERYNSPDGNYYAAFWSIGERQRLAILRPGGEVVIEVYAADFGPPPPTTI